MATFYVLITAYPFPSLCTFIPLPRHFALCGNVLFALHLISLCRTRTTLESRAKLLLHQCTYGTGSAFSFLARRKRWWSSCVDINQEPPFHCAWVICIEGKDQSKQLLPVIFLLYADSLFIYCICSHNVEASTISLHNCYICYATLMLISSPIVCSEGYCC